MSGFFSVSRSTLYPKVSSPCFIAMFPGSPGQVDHTLIMYGTIQQYTYYLLLYLQFFH